MGGWCEGEGEGVWEGECGSAEGREGGGSTFLTRNKWPLSDDEAVHTYYVMYGKALWCQSNVWCTYVALADF